MPSKRFCESPEFYDHLFKATRGLEVVLELWFYCKNRRNTGRLPPSYMRFLRDQKKGDDDRVIKAIDDRFRDLGLRRLVITKERFVEDSELTARKIEEALKKHWEEFLSDQGLGNDTEKDDEKAEPDHEDELWKKWYAEREKLKVSVPMILAESQETVRRSLTSGEGRFWFCPSLEGLMGNPVLFLTGASRENVPSSKTSKVARYVDGWKDELRVVGGVSKPRLVQGKGTFDLGTWRREPSGKLIFYCEQSRLNAADGRVLARVLKLPEARVEIRGGRPPRQAEPEKEEPKLETVLVELLKKQERFIKERALKGNRRQDGELGMGFSLIREAQNGAPFLLLGPAKELPRQEVDKVRRTAQNKIEIRGLWGQNRNGDTLWFLPTLGQTRREELLAAVAVFESVGGKRRKAVLFNKDMFYKKLEENEPESEPNKK